MIFKGKQLPQANIKLLKNFCEIECAIQLIIYDPRLKTKPVSLDRMCGITNDALKVLISQMLRISCNE